MIATPLVDSKGPRAAYGEVNKALQKEGVFDYIPLRRIFLRSPSDKVLKSLEKESKTVPQETFRVVNEQIGGNFVEDAYLYAGSIDILRIKSPGTEENFRVIYSPGSGGRAVPSVRVQGFEKLRNLLQREIRIRPEIVERAIRDLAEKGDAATIPNVQLKPSELKRLGLV